MMVSFLQGTPSDDDWDTPSSILDASGLDTDMWSGSDNIINNEDIGQAFIAGICTELVVVQEIIPHDKRCYIKLYKSFKTL